jgi:hypothetical protein
MTDIKNSNFFFTSLNIDDNKKIEILIPTDIKLRPNPKQVIKSTSLLDKTSTLEIVRDRVQEGEYKKQLNIIIESLKNITLQKLQLALGLKLNNYEKYDTSEDIEIIKICSIDDIHYGPEDITGNQTLIHEKNAIFFNKNNNFTKSKLQFVEYNSKKSSIKKQYLNLFNNLLSQNKEIKSEDINGYQVKENTITFLKN